jgi:peptidoglycan hydrolase-like protein with peptidoglycan-binding domain
MKGQDVFDWQVQLKRDGFAVFADGIYGPNTRNATMIWQCQRGIPSDGVVGSITRIAAGWQRLYGTHGPFTPPASVNAGPPYTPTPPASVNAGHPMTRECLCGIARQDCEYHR